MNKLRLIFVHGISAEIIHGDYTESLCDLIRARLTDLGDVSEIITFDRIDYSALGQAAEERVLASYEKERPRIYGLPDQVLERIAFDSLRRAMITSVSDCLVYESERWREHIRSLLVDAIAPYVATGDAVSIVGHSLGSVVAFDTAYYNSRHNPEWLKAGFKPTNLFTMGSPIALFSLELDDQTGEQKPRYFPADQTPADMDPANTNADLQPTRPEGVWWNFLDAQDLIAYPLEELFRGKFAVQDFRVETGTFPIHAHTAYWQNTVVANRIAARLKLDFARINAPAAVGP